MAKGARHTEVLMICSARVKSSVQFAIDKSGLGEPAVAKKATQ
jgi:hypothetical protein